MNPKSDTMRLLQTCALVMICSSLSFSQSFYIKSGTTLFVGTGTVMMVEDSLVNNGILINNGSLTMSGVWLNDGTYQPGDGHITFNGSSGEQIINHNAQAFSWLAIEGGGVKKFLADIVIEQELVLSDGILTAENGSKIDFAQSAIITGGSDQSHINGVVQQSGTGDKLFPIGNGSMYLPVQISNLTSPAQIQVSGTELNGSVELVKSSSLLNISDQRYFTVDVITGSLGSVSITLPIRNEDALVNVESVVVAEAALLTDPFINLGSSASSGSLTNGMVTSERPLTGRFFAIATAGSEIIVYNAIAPNGHEDNKYLRVTNLTKPNRVTIFNRWGDKVFEVQDYDDTLPGKRFEGLATGGKELPSGTYFYKIEIGTGTQSALTGYLSLKW
jgi:gliding motility-associated-like protein